jgi:uncharacterized protein
MKQFNPEDFKVFECITGSHLYGTNTPESDIDYRGVCCPPLEILLNPFTPFEQKDSGFEEEDKAIYNLSKFMKLCADSNPNIIELLFVPDNKILYKTKEWETILKNKKSFLSKKARYTFTGYAFSQLNAIKNHRQWFLDPPKNKPHRKDFGLTDSPIISGENLDTALSINLELFKEKYQDELQKEREYRLSKKKWDNYVSWATNRNPARKELEDRFGYDVKHASHLIRLMTEGKELLLTGNITFPLENCEEIKAIRNGKYVYEEIIFMAETLEKEFEDWYEKSILPKSPDRKALTELYLCVILNKY